MDPLLPEYVLSLMFMAFGVLFAYIVYANAFNGLTIMNYWQIFSSLVLGLGGGGTYLYLFAAPVGSWKRWASLNHAKYNRPKGLEESEYGMVTDELSGLNPRNGKHFVVRRTYKSSLVGGGRSWHVLISRYVIVRGSESTDSENPLLIRKYALKTPSIDDLLSEFNNLNK